MKTCFILSWNLLVVHLLAKHSTSYEDRIDAGLANLISAEKFAGYAVADLLAVTVLLVM